MENQETSTHGTSHNLALLLIFVVVIALLALSINKFSHPAPQPAPKVLPRSTNITVTQKGETKTYADNVGGFRFQYPSDVVVNDDGVFKYDTLNLNYQPITSLDRKLGNDFPPDQYAILATAITNGTTFQPVRTASNPDYPIRKDFTTVKIGNHYYVRDFPVTNTDCGCTQIQYVTIVGKYFVSYAMAKGIVSPAKYQQSLRSDKEGFINQTFPTLAATLASLTSD